MSGILPLDTHRERLRERFKILLERYVHKLILRGSKVTGLAPCHQDSSPSFSANLEKCKWYCFSCAQGGGVKEFAELVGEPWEPTHRTKPATKARRAALARQRAEEEAKTILKHRQEERDTQLLAQHQEAHDVAVEAVDIFGLFHRHPELVEEMPELLDAMEQQCGEAINQLAVLGARLDGELAI